MGVPNSDVSFGFLSVSTLRSRYYNAAVAGLLHSHHILSGVSSQRCKLLQEDVNDRILSETNGVC